MKFKFFLLSFLTLINTSLIFAFDDTDAVVMGHVVSGGEHIPFVNIYLEDTNHGTATDVTGHYMMVDLPLGDFVIVARMVGYKTMKKNITIKAGQTFEVNFELEEDYLRVNEVVITGTRTFKRQTESAVIVNVLDAKTIQNIAAETV